MITREHVGPQVAASDGKVSRALDERPPLSLKKGFVREPVRDGLLGDTGVPNLSHTLGESSLAPAGDIDRALQGNNVALLHGHTKYTNQFVSATTPFVLQKDKEVCTVLDMATSKAVARRQLVKPPKPRKEKRRALPGADGLVLGQRVREAMAYKRGRLGTDYRPADLMRDVNKLAKAPADEPFLSQQLLSAILRDEVTETSKTPFIAMACGVSPTWMSLGIGRMVDS
jgi:hypothetical protein